MTCQEFEEIVADLAADKVILARTRIAALTHVAVCGQCNERLTAEKVLTEGLLAFAEQTNGAQASSRVKQSLKAAFEAQHAANIEAAAPNVIRLVDYKPVARRQWAWTLAAAAAVIVFAVAVFVWRNQRSSEKPVFVAGSSPTPALTPVIPNPSVDAAARQNNSSPTQVNATAINKMATTKKSLRTNRTQGRQAGEKELAANYIPLNYAASAMSDESLVVRVDVSRTALIAMGLPLSLNAESGNEMVKADLRVGLDGIPLAIRLVR